MSGAAALLLALPLLAQTQAPASADALARLRAASLAPSPEMARLRALCDGIGGRVTGTPACDGTYAVVDGGDGGEAALAALGERAKGAFVYLRSEVSQTSGSGPQASMAAQPPSANLDSLAPEACAPSSRAA